MVEKKHLDELRRLVGLLEDTFSTKHTGIRDRAMAH